MMTRRHLIAALPAAALGEVAAPTTPEGRLREAAQRWQRAERSAETALRTLHECRSAIYGALVEGASEHALARFVEVRCQARAEWRSAVREQAEAEAQMETASRAVRGG